MTAGRGRDAEYTAFVTARTPGLLRFGYLLTGSRSGAVSLLRDALVALWPRWAEVSRDGAEEHWVRTRMARRQVSRRRRVPTAAADGPAAAPAPSWHVTDTDSEHIQDAAWAALAGMTPLARVVLVLRFHEGLSERETAEVLGRPVATVTTQAGLVVDRLPDDPAELDRTTTLTRSLTRHAHDVDGAGPVTGQPSTVLAPDELVAEARHRRRRNRRLMGAGVLVVALAVALTVVLSDGGTPAGPPSSTSRPSGIAPPSDVLVQAELLRVQQEVTRSVEAALSDAMDTSSGPLVVTPVYAPADGAPMGWSAALALPATPGAWSLRVEVYLTGGRYRAGMGDLRCDGTHPTVALCGRSTIHDADVVFRDVTTRRIRNADGALVGYERTADRLVFRTNRRVSAVLQQVDLRPGASPGGTVFDVYSGPVNRRLLTRLARSSDLAALPLPPDGSRATGDRFR